MDKHCNLKIQLSQKKERDYVSQLPLSTTLRRSNFEMGQRLLWQKVLMCWWNFLCLPPSLTAFDMSPFLSQCTAVLEPEVAQNCQKSDVLPFLDLYQQMENLEEEFHKVFCVWQFVHYFLLKTWCGYCNYSARLTNILEIKTPQECQKGWSDLNLNTSNTFL